MDISGVEKGCEAQRAEIRAASVCRRRGLCSVCLRERWDTEWHPAPGAQFPVVGFVLY